MSPFPTLSTGFGAPCRSARRRLAGALLVAVAAGASDGTVARAQLPAPSGAVADLLERVGIRPLEPATAAVDLELVDLAGSPIRLSESAGRFVVLTFFATWCRPCAIEMPTLQTLHDEDPAVEVWAVSVDATAEPVAPFLRQLGMDVPVLWDREGVAARVYRAGAIPVSYVIDPSGRIVGLARGARDWSLLVGFFEQLAALGVSPASPPADAGWVDPAPTLEPIDLPLRLTPPEATVRLVTDETPPGRDFTLEVTVRWAGDFEQYLLHPPQVVLPEGVEQVGVAATTSSRAGASVVVYRVTLRSDVEGEHALDPVELRYTPIHETEPVVRRLPGPTVTVRPPRWRRALPVVLGSVLGAAGSAAVVMLLFRRRRRETSREGLEEDRRKLSSAIAEIRRMRVDGDGAGALARLSELVSRWIASEEIGADRRELEAWLERCRYGGEQPPAEVLDPWLKRLERRARTPDDPEETKLRDELGLPG